MNTKFTKGPWIICDGDSTDSSDLITTNYRSVENNIVPIAEIETEFDGIIGTEQEANTHLIAAAPDMYKSLERQRAGLINLMELNLVPESYFKSVRHEISLIDNELSRARGE